MRSVHRKWQFVFAALLSASGMASATDTPESVVQKLWALSSHGPNQGVDVPALSALFHEDAVVFGGRYREGVPSLSRRSKAEFMNLMAPVSSDAFYECEIERRVVVQDRFASVYSVVESRSKAQTGAADFVGANSLQLFKTGQGWKVISLYYFVGKPDTPLTTTGVSGACL